MRLLGGRLEQTCHKVAARRHIRDKQAKMEARAVSVSDNHK